MIKWRFFRHLAASGDPDAERVYRWHIEQRTGGREPGSWKASVDDYVAAAGELLRSMQARGFDPAHPVPIGSNGRIRGGAHRIACALALGRAVVIERLTVPGRAAPWDAEWLRSGGMAASDLARVLADMEALRGA